MKTDAERTELILKRAARLQQAERIRRRHVIDAGCIAACLVLVIGLSIAMPGWTGAPVSVPAAPTGTAGLLSERGADGYILVGLLSFLLGCTVTILLYRLRRGSDKKHPGDHDEL